MTKPRRRKLPPVRSKTLRRKGNHPANPYPVPKKRLDDREGWPFPGPSRLRPELRPRPQQQIQLPPLPAQHTDLTDEAQLGEPRFELRASDPLASHIVRYWARANDYLGTAVTKEQREAAMRLAFSMEAWRKRHEPRP